MHTANPPTPSPELAFLDVKIQEQARQLAQWRRPSEALIFETLRAIDHAYCEELFVADDKLDEGMLLHRSLLTWGVNKALATMMPDELSRGAFRLFPSKEETQGKADLFLLQCGVLEHAELLRGLLAEGLLSARLETPHPISRLVKNILVLKTNHPSLLGQAITIEQRRWLSEFVRQSDAPWEHDLEQRHLVVLPELKRSVDRHLQWGMSYSSTEELDHYFLEWGQVYLRRMWSQDLIGPEEKMGGGQFNEYLGVLAALSGRSQKHLCYAMILKNRHPELDIRNLLTTFAPFDEFVASLARFLDADALHVQRLLASLTLEPANKSFHLNSARTAWAPVVRATHEHCMLPMYGLEINPFHFLLNDLQARYPKDWDVAANNRETRWLGELKAIFGGAGWRVAGRNVPLREGGRTVTDIDFLAYDEQSNEAALFQLKWQQPVGVDTRARRSAAKNLVEEGNRWIGAVGGWLRRNGAGELGRRAGLHFKSGVDVEMFVLARYDVLFPGVAERGEGATWADWAHFLRVLSGNLRSSPKELAQLLKAAAKKIEASHSVESFPMPLGDLTVILNPAVEPKMS